MGNGGSRVRGSVGNCRSAPDHRRQADRGGAAVATEGPQEGEFPTDKPIDAAQLAVHESPLVGGQAGA
ncbi:hypothetical protein RSO01_26210 [Reyranella soli]|uniref:Uncharacterized protein n=1 Tax=Reyranella soli TaxID=1230389 RepID=A0A512N8Y7_9HYPH|nr:hypothetical protein RSO01_26210 [Reyranella soli]